jgi:hypothetical protein
VSNIEASMDRKLSRLVNSFSPAERKWISITLRLLPLIAILVFVIYPITASYLSRLWYTFEVLGTVRSAADGQPLPGVRISVNSSGQKDLPAQKWNTTQSNQAGEFESKKIRVYYGRFQPAPPTWYFKFEKAGYITELVEVTPKEPKLYPAASIVPAIWLRPEPPPED